MHAIPAVAATAPLLRSDDYHPQSYGRAAFWFEKSGPAGEPLDILVIRETFDLGAHGSALTLADVQTPIVFGDSYAGPAGSHPLRKQQCTFGKRLARGPQVALGSVLHACGAEASRGGLVGSVGMLTQPLHGAGRLVQFCLRKGRIRWHTCVGDQQNGALAHNSNATNGFAITAPATNEMLVAFGPARVRRSWDDAQ